MKARAAVAALALSAMAQGCLGARATRCPDGSICPADKACAPAGGLCVDRSLLEACRATLGGAPGTSCSVGDRAGVCREGLCVVPRCGDGAVDPGEACDGAGCAADCSKGLACGDAIVDEGEACDDANDNPSDGCDACRATAWKAGASSTPMSTCADPATGCAASVSVTASGTVYVSDPAGGRLLRLEATDATIVVVGEGLLEPAGLALDAAGTLYVAERGGHRISRRDPEGGALSVLSGTGVPGFAGMGGAPVASASYRGPSGLFLDEQAQRLYVADAGNHVVRAIDLAVGTVSLVAGTPQTLGLHGDGGPATAGVLYRPEGVTRCPSGDLYIADTGNHRVRRVAAGTALLSTVLGDGSPSSAGQGAPSRLFSVDTPRGLVCDSRGNVFVAARDGVRLLAAGAGPVDGEGAVRTIYMVSGEPACVSGLALADDAHLVVLDACAGGLVELVREVLP